MQVAVDALKSLTRPTQVTSFINTRSGIRLDPKQINHMKKKMKEATQIRLDVIEEIAGGNEVPDPTCQPTPADRLLSALEGDPRCSCTVSHGNHESDELKVHRRQNKPGSKSSTKFAS